MSNIEQMSESQQQSWLREQYQGANKYLADKGYVVQSVNEAESRYLVPVIAIWKLNLMANQSVWVICGDVPTDHVKADVASSARDAIKHFSLKWQLQADSLLQNDGEEQTEFARVLIGRAEGLYQIYDDEKLWGQS